MLVLKFYNRWYKYLLFFTLAYTLVGSVVGLMVRFRLVYIVYIFLCVLIVVYLVHPSSYVFSAIRILAFLHLFSGSLILIGYFFYLLVNSLQKIVIANLVLSGVHVFLGFVLAKYLKKSIGVIYK